MSELRKVMVRERKYTDGKSVVVEKGIAKFHQWGLEVEEGDSGFASYTVAIVEWPDGSVGTEYPRDVSFLSE